jgi:hypothetical protein
MKPPAAARTLLALAVAGCATAGPTEVVSRSGQTTALQPVGLRVIAPAEASASGFAGRPFVLPFGGDRDGTELVGLVLAEAERQGAVALGDISVTLAAAQDGRPIACRTAILPETVQETRWVPPSTRMVPVSKPVSRLVTENHYRCRPVSQSQTRYVTEYRQDCRTVSRPVTRTRTTHSYQYSPTGSRSVPRTETYTSYESRQECRSEPVHRTKTEYVTKNECRYETQSHTVTRYEHQLESRYVPPRLETFEKHRLREAEPVCYSREGAVTPPPPPHDGGAPPAAATAPTGPPAPAASNRIEATFYFRAASP